MVLHLDSENHEIFFTNSILCMLVRNLQLLDKYLDEAGFLVPHPNLNYGIYHAFSILWGKPQLCFSADDIVGFVPLLSFKTIELLNNLDNLRL